MEIGRTRVQDASGCIGTVQYVGPVRSCKNYPNVTYVGVEWDDPNRGKHNGTVVCAQTGELVAHFSCKYPTGASFLKESKVKRGISLSVGVLKDRYVPMDDRLIAPDNRFEHSALTSSGRTKPIEFLGELKIRGRQQLDDLRTLSLRRMAIAKIPSTPDLASALYRATVIDLAGNLLYNWNDVFELLCICPNLTSLNLAGNRLLDIEEISSLSPHTKLELLNLNQTGISKIHSIHVLGQALPELRELCLSHCYIDFHENDCNISDSMKKLELLDLSDTQISSIGIQNLHLSEMIHLQRLALDDNPMDAWPDSSGFDALVHLQLDNVQISDWKNIELLNNLGKLRSLRLSCPLEPARFLMIARFSQLENFNGSSVSARERTDAERRYLSRFDQGDEGGHWERLQAKHNIQSAPKTLQSSSSQSWSDSLMDCTISSMLPNSCERPPLVRRLPSSLTVGRVVQLAARYFEEEDNVSLYARTEDGMPLCLDDVTRTLDYYALTNPVELLLQEPLAVETSVSSTVDWEQKINEQEASMKALSDAKQRHGFG